MKNELRIGNYVSGDINQLIVVNVDNLGVHVTLKELWFKPIPLTEEWLVKFKEWKKEDNLYVIRLDTINYSLRPDYINNDGELCWEFYVHNIRGEKVGCAYIKYVHQLQNLYFALTGQELTIKHN